MTLRRYTEGDIDLIYEQLGCKPEMIRYTGWNPYFSLESTRQMLKNFIAGYTNGSGDYSWVIEVDEKPVGTIGAYDYSIEENSIEIGYSIFVDCWGKGYASRALSMVCDYLLKEEGLDCIKAWSAKDNIGSIRVLEKVGFIKTGEAADAIKVDEETHDQILFDKR